MHPVSCTPGRPELPPFAITVTASGFIDLVEAHALASSHHCGLMEALGELEARLALIA